MIYVLSPFALIGAIAAVRGLREFWRTGKMNWVGWVFVMCGPWRITCSAGNPVGRWCLPRAGRWAYRDRVGGVK